MVSESVKHYGGNMDYNYTWKNNEKLKLMIVCGTRPEIIRLAAVMKQCRNYFDTCIVYTNQNWDTNLSTVFWQDFDLGGTDVLLQVVGKHLGETCGNILSQTYELMVDLKPEAVLVLGDTNSCLSAISAKRLHIPVFHMEAGNRCKDENLPEETNRRIVDVISDVNMAYSEPARKYLHELGMPKERTYVTGSPMAEVLRGNLEKIEKSDVLDRFGLEADKYILLSAHREENIDSEKNFTSLFTAINALAEKYDMPLLYSCHPRSKKRLETSGFKLDPRVRVNEPLGFNDYNKLQMNALAIVSDSGTLPEESSFYLSIGHPIAAVCIRTSTERPEALEAGDFVLAGISTTELLQATEIAIDMKQKGIVGKPCPDYIDECVSMKVVRIIQSYTNIVNRMVWRKDL
jgi:UDP-N-acetylglucosamine 2-epimerase